MFNWSTFFDAISSRHVVKDYFQRAGERHGNISTVVLIMLVAGMARIKKLDLDQTIRFLPRRARRRPLAVSRDCDRWAYAIPRSRRRRTGTRDAPPSGHW